MTPGKRQGERIWALTLEERARLGLYQRRWEGRELGSDSVARKQGQCEGL